MKRLFLFLLLLLISHTTAYGAPPVSIVTPLDSRGPVATAEQYPDRDWVLIQPKVFQTRFVYGADGSSNGWGGAGRAVTIDSTSAIKTLGYKNLMLLFSVVMEDSANIGLFGFQVRGHSTTGIDTLSTFALPNFNKASVGPDTIGSFLDYRAGINFGSAGSSTQWQVGGATADTNTLMPGERPLIVHYSNGLVGQYFVVPINSTDGVPFVPPYTSFRLRLMNTFYATETGGAGLVAIGSGTQKTYGSANLSSFSGICEKCGGHPARSAYGRSISITADLIGVR